MTQRDVSFMLAALNIIAATILELCGMNPRDQVLLGVLFGFYAIYSKEATR